MKYYRPILLIHIMIFTLCCKGPCCEELQVLSPDGKTVVDISIADTVKWSVKRNGENVLAPSQVTMDIDGYPTLGIGAGVKKTYRCSKREIIEAPFYRQSSFESCYNELRIGFRGGYAITFRVYDDGCAYRFETTMQGKITVAEERAEFNFEGDPRTFTAYSDGLANAYQATYEDIPLSGVRPDGLIMLPVAVKYGESGTALICESDLRSYPGMFLVKQGGGFRSLSAGVPDSVYIHPRRCQEKVASRKNHIAETDGTRTFPWRIIAIAEKDADLPVNNMVYALGEHCRMDDCSWIGPGKAAWEWWNHWGLTDVGFQPGINTETYKTYIDFASDYGIEYVIMDEGWSDPQAGDIMSAVPEIDLPEIIGYASQRNVGIILWAVANVLDTKREEACRYYASLGVKGFKVDFIDRDDQQAVDLIYRLAKTAAKNRLMLDIHGTYKPTGLNRTFPNIINFEGVFGLEELKWSNPDMPSYDVTFPYIRMAQGPVDYTQGAFRNATPEGFRIDYHAPMSQGTRAHQVAAYVVFDSPLVMLCDSPSQYMADEKCTRYIAAIPTVFDRTEVIAGEIGEYIVTARKKGEDWYVGGLTNWTPRSIPVGLPFLPEGGYTALLLSDAGDAGKFPTHYEITELAADRESVLTIPMSPGGGFAIRLTKN